MEKAKIPIQQLVQQYENELTRTLEFFHSPKFKEHSQENAVELCTTHATSIYQELIEALKEVLVLIESHHEYSEILNQTRRKRDEVKNKLTLSLKEISMRKKYESFLLSCIISGESFDHDFEWFCEKYEQERSGFKDGTN
jgi:hypothetical protein